MAQPKSLTCRGITNSYMERSRILSPEAIEARIQRMAFQVYERNYHETRLVVIGIDQRGGMVAERLVEKLRKISPIELTLASATLDHEDRQGRVEALRVNYSVNLNMLQDAAVLIVDDVLYSGNSMMHVIAPLVQAMPRTIQIAVLIDRGHRRLPVSADFIGEKLATTLQQHVHVAVDANSGQMEAFLH